MTHHTSVPPTPPSESRTPPDVGAPLGHRPARGGERSATARVLIVASYKGGTGKSTLAANIAVALARVYGLRVHVVDLDPQTASGFLGVHAVEDPFGADPVEVWGIWLFPGGEALGAADPERVARHVERAREGADLVIVDVRGTRQDDGQFERLLRLPGVRVLGVPAAEPRSLPEIAKLVTDVTDAGVPFRLLTNCVVTRQRISVDVAQALRRHFRGNVLAAEIPQRVDVQYAEKRRAPVVVHRPRSVVSVAIQAAAQELVAGGFV